MHHIYQFTWEPCSLRFDFKLNTGTLKGRKESKRGMSSCPITRNSLEGAIYQTLLSSRPSFTRERFSSSLRHEVITPILVG